MILGIDIDDVIADFITTLATFHNIKYGSDLTKKDFTSYDFWEVWGGTKEEAVRKVDEMFADPNYYEKIPIIERSFYSLEKFKRMGFNLHAITGRRDNAITQTRNWVKMNFPNIFSDIHFTNSYCLEGKSEKKSKICRRLGVTTIIEDHSKHAIDCAKNGIRVLLFNCPWNKSLIETQNIQRVFSWDEITKII